MALVTIVMKVHKLSASRIKRRLPLGSAN